MTKTLHILNGDGLASNFKKSAIQGDICIWRELMCEGPAFLDPMSPEFWKLRALFFAKVFGESEKGYNHKVLLELDKLISFNEYDKVVLWFEHDLVCQINLMFLLNWFSLNSPKEGMINLVCIGEHPEIERFRGLGQLSPKQLEELYQEKEIMSAKDIDYGKQFWEAYCSDSILALDDFSPEENYTFPFVRMAIKNYSKLYPSTTHGYNYIETTILKILRKKALSQNELIEKWLRIDKQFGFGDLQLIKHINFLKPKMLTEVNGKLELTKEGIDLVVNNWALYNRGCLNNWLRGRNEGMGSLDDLLP